MARPVDPPVTWVAVCPEHRCTLGRGDSGELLCKHGHAVENPAHEPFVHADTLALMLLSDGRWDTERRFEQAIPRRMWDALKERGWMAQDPRSRAFHLTHAGEVELLARMARAGGGR
jgi:hypothetical protein